MRILFNIFLILLTLAVLIWVVWQGFLLISSGGQYLEASQRAILAGAALIAVVCTFMVSHAIRQSGKGASMAGTVQRRMELYEDFLVVWQALIHEANEKQRMKLVLQLEELKVRLAIHASPNVVNKALYLLNKSNEEGAEHTQDEFDALLIAMRADMRPEHLYPFRNELKELLGSSLK